MEATAALQDASYLPKKDVPYCIAISRLRANVCRGENGFGDRRLASLLTSGENGIASSRFGECPALQPSISRSVPNVPVR